MISESRSEPRRLPVGVAVCAYTTRRWPQLRRALIRAADQGPDELVLVVDHNEELAVRARAELTREIPGLRVVDNRRQPGLSGARNTALDELRTELVVFLDDDATPEPGWLSALVAPFQLDPANAVVAVGGVAEPVWPTQHPVRPLTLPAAAGPQVRGELDWVVGCSYTGQPEQQAPVRNVMGCSMAFRRAPVLEVGGFAEHLGRVQNLPLGCEETELCLRLAAADARTQILFEPRARVRHHVSADRVGWPYLVRRCWSEGRSKAAVARLAGASRALSTERAYLTRVLPRALRRELTHVVLGAPRYAAEEPRQLRRRASAARAGALVLGTSMTVLGYVRGRLSRRLA